MRRWAEITSFLVGAVAALVLLAGWRVPQSRDTIGAAARISIARSPVVELSRTGTVLDETHLMPGDAAVTTVDVTNPGASTVRLAPAIQGGGDRAFDGMLRLTIRADGARVFSGRLAGLTGNAARVIRLAPGDSTRVAISLRLPLTVGRAFAGRGTQASIAFGVAP